MYKKDKFNLDYENAIAAVENGRVLTYKDYILEVRGHGIGASNKWFSFERYYPDGSHSEVRFGKEEYDDPEIFNDIYEMVLLKEDS